MKHVFVALAGNANVGKSVIFNQLTGSSQEVGNWPGKTVEKAEGTLYYEGLRIRVVDLPGIYSLSTFSIEEIIARDFLLEGGADVVVDVVDASALERNLYLTIQLMELEVNLVIALNQIDFAAKRGVRVDYEKLSEMLEVPVVPTIAVSGYGLDKLLKTIKRAVEGKISIKAKSPRYSADIEEKISQLSKEISEKLPELSSYPSRWLAIKLLEKDSLVGEKVLSCKRGEEIVSLASKLIEEIERARGEDSALVIVSERYRIANRVAAEVQSFQAKPKASFSDKLEEVTAHPVMGYIVLIGVILSIFALVFGVGGVLSEIIEDLLLNAEFINKAASKLPETARIIVLDGVYYGVVASLTVALPYVLPFYIILAILEDSGYLARAACLTDNLMHKIGLHGKAFIPLMVSFGCNVPGCVGCRIMETERERLIAGILTVLIPCSARTVVILGLIGKYLGLKIALVFYLLDFVLIFVIGRIAYKSLPGKAVGLIMEVPPYRMPQLKSVVMKTWWRTREFTFFAIPVIVLGSSIIAGIEALGATQTVINYSKFITRLLGLPAECAIPLVFGILRKELTLILLAEVAGTNELSSFLTFRQMIVFTLVVMVYIPCIATVAALAREYGWKKALAITTLYIVLALALGAIANNLLLLIGVG